VSHIEGKALLNATSAHFKEAKRQGYKTYQSGNWLNAVFCSGTNYIYQYGFKHCEPFSTYKEDPKQCFYD
jgi:hypothetical protein